MSYDHLYDMYYEVFEDDDDTAFCEICGNYYCIYCGCNCWMDDDFEEDDEE